MFAVIVGRGVAGPVGRMPWVPLHPVKRCHMQCFTKNFAFVLSRCLGQQVAAVYFCCMVQGARQDPVHFFPVAQGGSPVRRHFFPLASPP